LRFHGSVNNKYMSQTETEIILRILESSLIDQKVLLYCLKVCRVIYL